MTSYDVECRIQHPSGRQRDEQGKAGAKLQVAGVNGSGRKKTTRGHSPWLGSCRIAVMHSHDRVDKRVMVQKPVQTLSG